MYLAFEPAASAQADADKAAPVAEKLLPNPEITTTAADAEWEALQGSAVAEKPSLGNAAKVASARKKAIDDADRLKAFYTKNPKHIKAREAKALETLSLLEGRALGDGSQQERCDKLVFEVRRDRSIPFDLRVHVAAWADHLAVAGEPDLSRAERLHAYEKIVRRLLHEFPEWDAGYESLLNLARDSADDRAISICRELVLMEKLAVAAEAQTILDRHALIGQPITSILEGADKAKPSVFALTPGQPTVVYSWAVDNPASIRLAKQISREAPAGTHLYGVNLDVARGEAAQVAAGEKLPGDQIYAASAKATVAALKLSEAALVYVVDANGVVRSVAARNDLSAAFKTLLPQ